MKTSAAVAVDAVRVERALFAQETKPVPRSYVSIPGCMRHGVHYGPRTEDVAHGDSRRMHG
jgi:hypothetical protein